MITLIHGDNLSLSISKLDELTSSYPLVLRFDLGKEGIETVLDSLKIQDLFGEEKVIVAQKFSKLTPTLKKEFVTALNSYKEGDLNDLVLFEETELQKNMIPKINACKVHVFPLPKYIFTFLDSLVPGRGSYAAEQLSHALVSTSAEQIFSMLTKRVKILLLLKLEGSQEFQEIGSLQNWQKKRLIDQSLKWNRDSLVGLYQQLFQLEVSQKTSNLPLPLAKHLDILVLSALK